MEMAEPGILKKRAEQAAAFSYSPFSHFAVGAALKTANGEIFVGCNMESSSYGLTLCAERNAIAAAVAHGHRKFSALAIYSRTGAQPCGACRQVIWDICGDIPIFTVNQNGVVKRYTSAELLPNPFDKRDLEGSKAL